MTGTDSILTSVVVGGASAKLNALFMSCGISLTLIILFLLLTIVPYPNKYNVSRMYTLAYPGIYKSSEYQYISPSS